MPLSDYVRTQLKIQPGHVSAWPNALVRHLAWHLCMVSRLRCARACPRFKRTTSAVLFLTSRSKAHHMHGFPLGAYSITRCFIICVEGRYKIGKRLSLLSVCAKPMTVPISAPVFVLLQTCFCTRTGAAISIEARELWPNHVVTAPVQWERASRFLQYNYFLVS